ncbi:TPA: hypothetical protein ACWSJY_003838, partial [Escherichia coli]
TCRVKLTCFIFPVPGILIPSRVFCPTLPAWQKEFTWCIKVNNHKPLTFVVISSRTMMWLVN